MDEVYVGHAGILRDSPDGKVNEIFAGLVLLNVSIVMDTEFGQVLQVEALELTPGIFSPEGSECFLLRFALFIGHTSRDSH